MRVCPCIRIKQRAVQVHILVNNAVIYKYRNVGKCTDSVIQFEVKLFKVPFENL